MVRLSPLRDCASVILREFSGRNLLKVKVVPPQASSMYPLEAIDLPNVMRDGIACAEQLRAGENPAKMA